MASIGFIRGASLAAAFCICLPDAPAQEGKRTPAAALQQLRDGNDRFVANQPEKRDTGSRRLKELAKGQHPQAVVLACADSRVAPELIFDQGLGVLFVIRVAGNVTDPDVLGSIEYALAELKTPLIVVLGHESCGAVKAALARHPLTGNLRALIDKVHVGEVAPAEGKTSLPDAIRHNVVYQVEELSRKSALIKEFIERERVSVAAGVYSLDTGRVQWLDVARKSGQR
jgi:carbonic anhydrase